PTSVGYGASFGGVAALLGLLTSCASNVTVVNIDNGFGAAFVASCINRRYHHWSGTFYLHVVKRNTQRKTYRCGLVCIFCPRAALDCIRGRRGIPPRFLDTGSQRIFGGIELIPTLTLGGFGALFVLICLLPWNHF